MTLEIDPGHFRSVMGKVPTCVTVVTAFDGENPVAMVIGSFVSVSLDPPLAGFFCTKTSGTWAQLRAADVMGVNVLAADQVDVSNACMREASERFEGLSWSSDGGAPKIEGAAAWLVLSLDSVVDAGDHDFALCKVLNLEASQGRDPLIFFGGEYRRIASQG